MANPNIPAALTALASHLSAAGAALPDPIQDVDRGLPTGGRMIRYYWGGEVDPPKLPARRSLNSDIVGQRFEIAATWPLTDLSPEQVTVIDVEMQLLAGEIRARIDGDSQLGGNVADLTLGNAEVDLIVISNVRYVGLRWALDLAYVEYALSA